MRVQMRRVNTKRHTTGYKIGGKWYTRAEAVKLAKSGKVEGVSVYRGEYGSYIQSLPTSDVRLEDLPIQVA